jgi:hypothetical protein
MAGENVFFKEVLMLFGGLEGSSLELRADYNNPAGA